MGCETTQVLATLVYVLTCIVYAMFAYWWNLLLSDLEIITFLINIFYTNFEARFLVCGWVVFFNTKTTIFSRTVKTMFWCLCWILCWYFVPARRTVICFCWSFCTLVTLVLFDFDLMFLSVLASCIKFSVCPFFFLLLFSPYTPPNKSTQYWICWFDDD